MNNPVQSAIRGRGAAANPRPRFQELHVSYDPGEAPERIGTKFFLDHSSTVITHHQSPDLGMGATLNPYRGCEHGCAYCYARPTHEYLGFSSGLDFETKIMVKQDAPALLRAALMKPNYRPEVLSMSGVTDCYQPLEKKMKVTRGCLEVLAEFRHPVSLITKNHLVTRDIDYLQQLAEHDAAGVYVSVTSLDHKLAHVLEPRASGPSARLDAIRELSRAGIPVGVSVAPIIPGLTDHEVPAILEAAKEAGANYAFYTVVRLPFSVKEVFTNWLENHFPDQKAKILGRIEQCQGRTLSHPEFGSRLRGEGIWATQIAQLFRVSSARLGLACQVGPSLSTHAFRRPPAGGQLELTLD